MKRNYKDDFDFILHLYSVLVDNEGKEVEGSRKELGWPGYDWIARIYTSSKANAYEASCIGGVCTNCFNDNDRVHIVVNDHHMGPGRMKVVFQAELPREIYSDGYQRNVIPEPLDIELTVGKGDLPGEFEAELLMPYIKGEPFTYSDFTPEQIEDLKRPAVEASTRADNAASEAKQAATAANTAADNAVKATEALKTQSETVNEAEQKRQTAEGERKTAEQTRETNETQRVNDEQTRQANETTRDTAENQRQGAEAQRQSAETNRENKLADIIRRAETALSSAQTAADAAQTAADAATKAAKACSDAATEFEKIRAEYFALNCITLEP